MTLKWQDIKNYETEQRAIPLLKSMESYLKCESMHDPQLVLLES